MSRRSADGPDRTGRWRRHRKEASAPAIRILLGSAAVAALVGGWWAVARWSVEAGGAAAGPLPYSVLVSTAASRGEAARRVRRLRRQLAPVPGEGEPAGGDSLRAPGAMESRGRTVVFVSPVARGDTLRWRVFAGCVADRTAAGRRMERLVRAGILDDGDGGDVRPVRFALLLGRWSTPEAAGRARAELGEDAIFTYVLREIASGDSSYLLYAGAFEEPRASGWLDATLREQGHRAQLMIRRGEPR